MLADRIFLDIQQIERRVPVVGGDVLDVLAHEGEWQTGVGPVGSRIGARRTAAFNGCGQLTAMMMNATTPGFVFFRYQSRKASATSFGSGRLQGVGTKSGLFVSPW